MIMRWEGDGGPRGTVPTSLRSMSPSARPLPRNIGYQMDRPPAPFTIGFRFMVRGKYPIQHLINERHEAHVITARREALRGTSTKAGDAG